MSVDELGELGMVRMDEAAMRDFLTNQAVGVLALPAEKGPYVIPLSYKFDGDSALYLVYALGAESRKEELTERAETARFLVYDAASPFDWQSVLLSGTIGQVPDAKWETIEAERGPSWRPELLEAAELSRGSKVYRFQIEEWVGIRHTGLPPGFEPEVPEAPEPEP